MENTGWVKLHRRIYQNPRSQDPDWVVVWVYLLCHVCWEPVDVIFRGKRITLTPGQITIGRKVLAKACGVGESKVERVLSLLESEQQIEQQTTNKCRLITIKNWAAHQSREQQIEQPVNNKRTTTEQQLNTNKEIKEYKEYKNISSLKIAEAKSFAENSGEVRLAKLLRGKILENHPKMKFQGFINWPSEVDKMLRLDNRTYEEVEFIISWSQQDSFWKANILSMGAVRKRFDQLMLKAKAQWEKQQSLKINSY